MQHCHNCGNEFEGNFCPICGQRAKVGRVGWSSIKDNIAVLWGMDSRSLGYTLFQLLTRPGYLVRDYISPSPSVVPSRQDAGHRGRYRGCDIFLHL